MTKQQLIEKLETIIQKSTSDNGYHYEIKINEWNNYGKSRTYFSIVETRDNSKHYATKKYGYFDNITNKYFPEKYGNIENNFTFSGSKF